MIIKRSTELENKIINTVKENWITKIRNDVALTDLIYPRKAYFQRVEPKEPTLTEILDFLRGKSRNWIGRSSQNGTSNFKESSWDIL